MNRIQRSALVTPLMLSMVLLGACRPDDTPAPETTSTTTTTTTTSTVPASSIPTVPALPAVPAPAPRPVVVTRAAVEQPMQPVRAVQVQQPVRSENFGQVVSIEPISEKESPSGVGAAAGGLLGGVLGHQIGGGSGRTAATVLGAVGGAVVGNQVEKRRSSHVVGYRVSVRTDAGGMREFQRTSVNDLSVGGNVRLVNGGVQPA